VILRASVEHAGVLSVLHATSFPAAWRESEFVALLAQPGVAAWIATDELAPLGFILVRAAADEAEILTLAVEPRHRRQGWAAHLMRQAFAQLRLGGTREVFLEVAADNLPAATLYERQGFTPRGRRPAYYSRGTHTAADAIVMRMVL